MQTCSDCSEHVAVAKSKLRHSHVSSLFARSPGGLAFGEIPMKNFASKINRFLKSEDGPTAVEYAVMLALIVVVCLGAITTIGENAESTFNDVSDQL